MSRNFELLQQGAKEDLLTPSGVVTPFEPKASLASLGVPTNGEIATLVQRLFLVGAQTGAPRVVAFSGIERDDRSSWICARAADALGAQTDASICVVDANLWSPQLHSHLGANNDEGLAAALTTSGPIRSFLQPLSPGNVWLLPSGVSRGHLHTQVDRLRARFAELRGEFNYVLVSAPSLTHKAKATMIGQLADGIVLIVEANQTRRKSVRQAKEHLEGAHVELLGAVLDQRTFPIPDFLYRKL